jgi:excinuclease ABC subunit C
VWAVTRMQAGKIDKSGYRRYRITSTDTWDDYLALEEVITRRFSKQPWPDVFVLDGWVGQLWIIKKLDRLGTITNWKDIKAHTTFIALWKGKARKRKGKVKGEQEYISYFDQHGDIDIVPLRYDTVDRLLILLRDEAHRFANVYRKKRMSQAFENMTKK